MTVSTGGSRQPASGQRPASPPTDTGNSQPERAWTVARSVLTVVFCASSAVALLEVYQAENAVLPTIVAAVLMAALLAIQLFHFSRPGADLKSPRSYVLLVVLAALAYLPLLEYGWTWLSLPPFLAGCLLLVLPRRTGWLGFTAILASLLAIRVALAEPPLTVAYNVANASTFALMVYLLTILAIAVAELHAARHDLAVMAVAEERLRFAKDLHDLLGLNLSAITLKGELTHRLLARSPERAKQELSEILSIARRALADVRSVASGYRDLSLKQETRAAEAVLTASDVAVRTDLDFTDLPVQVRNVLGKLLREGVTNVLRHSAAAHCDIVIRQSADAVTLDIVNDGVDELDDENDADAAGDGSDGEPSSGRGIHSLAERVVALHGVVDHSREGDRFRLHARVPLSTAPAPEPGARWRRAVTRQALVSMPTNTVPVNAYFCVVYVGAVIHQLIVATNVSTALWDAGYMTGLAALQVAVCSRVTVRSRSRRAYLVLLVQAVLIYLPLLQLGGAAWITAAGWLAGNALLWLAPVPAWLVFVGSVGATVWGHMTPGAQVLDVAFQAAATVITGLIAFGLMSLKGLIGELRAARTQLASRAVAEERLRFARDLHDLLGLSLSAITLKCELVNRLLTTDSAQAGDELIDILTLARQALVDVRAVADGDRELSLDREAESAEAVLTAADVAVRMDLAYEELPVQVRTVLAVMLREGVTNVLRHSKAERCDIVVRQNGGRVALSIVNDGAAAPRSRAPGGAPSSGTRNLSERVEKLGGELTHGPDGDGGYRLEAVLPL